MEGQRTNPATIAEVAQRLTAAGIAPARTEARWLVEHAEAGGEGAVEDRLEGLVRRREAGEPLQLLLGRWPFRTVELELAPGVFLPRPETEVVAGVAVRYATAAGPQPVVAEPCTGTGAIAASLLAEVPGVQVHASDIDPGAVALARRNLAAVAGAERFTVHAGDLLTQLPEQLRGQLDLLVANPPYLPSSDVDHLDIEVADHDPPAALFAGPDGHEVVDRLLELARAWLRPTGTVVLEIDARRGPAALIAAAGAGFPAAELVTDLTGRDRVLVAHLAADPPPDGRPPTGDARSTAEGVHPLPSNPPSSPPSSPPSRSGAGSATHPGEARR